jgi:REP element-mobilizing transposase RayT
VFGSTMHKAGGLYAHVTWHTWRRTRAVVRADIPLITAAINEAASRTDARVLGIGILKDHVHVVMRHSPNRTLTGFIRHAKSESSRRANLRRAGEGMLRWGRGYYAASVSQSHLEAARNYVGLQYRRHPDLIPE